MIEEPEDGLRQFFQTTPCVGSRRAIAARGALLYRDLPMRTIVAFARETGVLADATGIVVDARHVADLLPTLDMAEGEDAVCLAMRVLELMDGGQNRRKAVWRAVLERPQVQIDESVATINAVLRLRGGKGDVAGDVSLVLDLAQVARKFEADLTTAGGVEELRRQAGTGAVEVGPTLPCRGTHPVPAAPIG